MDSRPAPILAASQADQLRKELASESKGVEGAW